MLEFDSSKECAEYLRTLFSSLGEQVAESLAEKVAPTLEDTTSVPKGYGLGLILRRWVIRDDELDILKNARDAAMAAAPAGFFLRQATSTAIVGVIFAVLAITKNAWDRGARLSQDQLLILTCLKAANKPLRPENLAERLNLAPTDRLIGGRRWTPELAERELNGLLHVATNKAGFVALVAKDPEGNWLPRGV